MDDLLCPRCESDMVLAETKYAPWVGIVWMIFWAIVFFPMAFMAMWHMQQYCECGNCGHEWRVDRGGNIYPKETFLRWVWDGKWLYILVGLLCWFSWWVHQP